MMRLRAPVLSTRFDLVGEPGARPVHPEIGGDRDHSHLVFPGEALGLLLQRGFRARHQDQVVASFREAFGEIEADAAAAPVTSAVWWFPGVVLAMEFSWFAVGRAGRTLLRSTTGAQRSGATRRARRFS